MQIRALLVEFITASKAGLVAICSFSILYLCRKQGILWKAFNLERPSRLCSGTTIFHLLSNPLYTPDRLQRGPLCISALGFNAS
jgi:hypothetical protein